MKKGIILFMGLILLFSFVSAQGEKIGISALQETYQPGQNLTILVSLTDAGNNPLNAEIQLVFENVARTKRIERTIQSNKLETINLGQNIPALSWTVTAAYGAAEDKAFFTIDSSELAKFEIQGDKLIITNIGNIPYTKDVQILIGDTVGVKETGLDVGEQLTFRLIAPDGIYNIRITDGKTTLSKSDVALTGNAIGVLDERLGANIPITGNPPASDTDSPFSFSRNNLFAYIFVLVLIGAAVLLAIERRYSRLARNPIS